MEQLQAQRLRTPLWFDATGTVLWFTAFLVIAILVLINPDARSVVDNYRFGSERFLALQPLYNIELAGGYLYAPAFAALYAPFYLLGPHAGDVLWRLTAFAVLTWAVYRQARTIGDDNPLFIMSCALFLALPISAGALRNGQSTILLAGTCWLLVLAAIEKKPMQVVLWAALALLAKPTAIVVLLLAGAMRPRLIPALIAAPLIVLALPYAFAPFSYVNAVHQDFFALLSNMSLRGSQYFTPADFTAPFTALGIAIPSAAATVIRSAAAIATLAAVLWVVRHADRRMAGLVVFVLAAYYMSVFNPRVEGNTYALLAVPLGVSIALMFRSEGLTAPLPLFLGVLLFLAGFTSVDANIHKATVLWFAPVISTLIFASVIWWFWRLIRATQASTRSHG